MLDLGFLSDSGNMFVGPIREFIIGIVETGRAVGTIGEFAFSESRNLCFLGNNHFLPFEFDKEQRQTKKSRTDNEKATGAQPRFFIN